MFFRYEPTTAGPKSPEEYEKMERYFANLIRNLNHQMDEVDVLTRSARFEALNQLHEDCLHQVRALKGYSAWMRELS